MNFLLEIIEKTRRRVQMVKAQRPLEKLRAEASGIRTTFLTHAFRAALGHREQTNIIAEFKRRSPSKGPLRLNASPHEIAQKYKVGGAAAISVLTEKDYFDGSLDDLRAIKAAVDLPVLRKDFIIDEYQIYEAAANGADAVLLIVAALDDDELSGLREMAEDELGMDALVEVHTEHELRRATSSGATLIGINNRDLSTFEVSLETSIKLAALAPADALLVSESGLTTAADLRSLRAVGVNAFLIGESLMRATEPDKALRSFLTQ